MRKCAQRPNFKMMFELISIPLRRDIICNKEIETCEGKTRFHNQTYTEAKVIYSATLMIVLSHVTVVKLD